jgi:hypothetical protein
MRQFLFVSAFTVSLAVITPAMAQPWPAGIGSGPPPATAYPPPTAAPTTPNYGGNTAPGYQWRDERANTDWRNNTWREQRFNQDWRNNNWRTQRAEEDWQQRGNLEKQRTPNNATETGYVSGVTKPTAGTNNTPIEANPTENNAGECAIGSSEETCRRRGQKYNPPRQN